MTSSSNCTYHVGDMVSKRVRLASFETRCLRHSLDNLSGADGHQRFGRIDALFARFDLAKATQFSEKKSYNKDNSQWLVQSGLFDT